MAFPAVFLHYSAKLMPMSRAIAPHSPVKYLLGGDFRRAADYDNWRPRGTPDWLLIYTVAGSGKIVTAHGGEWRTAAGDVFVYEPHAYHDYGTAPASSGADRSTPAVWHLRWAHFHPRPHWLPFLRWPVRAPGLRWLHIEAEEVRRRVETALMETVRLQAQRELPGHFDLAVNAFERALLWVHTLQGGGGTWARLDDRVRRATELLAEDLRQPFSLPTLAGRCGLSVSRLAHLFKAQTGLSPQNFSERRRMERASQLLRFTNLSVGEIATEVGFESAFYFTRRFRRQTGLSPSQFRRSDVGFHPVGNVL